MSRPPSSPHPPPPIPIILLKSPSPIPSTDPYTTHLTTPSPTTPTQTQTYTPNFTPVLTHTLLPDPLITLLKTHPFPYGALILTSQRAVLALTTALNAPPLKPHLPTLRTLKLSLYTVGPATATSLSSVRDEFLPRCCIHGGAEAGSGEVLAGIILGTHPNNNGEVKEEGKYTTKAPNGTDMKPILFLTGEKRRDIIPQTLMASTLPAENRIPVEEIIVYHTTALDEFEFCFARVLQETEMARVRWVVVFSPTAGRGMLRALGWLDGRGKGRVDGDSGGRVDGKMDGKMDRKTFVACIGPTTREYLEREFGFRADVVAERPSPQGVRDGIERFMRERDTEASSEGLLS